EPLHITHRPSWRNAATVSEAEAHLRDRREHDLYMKTTTSGPHRDRFVYRYRDADFTKTASTGQLRLVSLILRVAQAQFFAARSGRAPLLLLDDVLLELDPRRRKAFLGELPHYEQAFFTFLPDERFNEYRGEHTLIYHVSDGSIESYGTSG
ncbi:MAG: DNA replication/repair protein RecF, partial [Spirochaetota bacterium]